MAKTFKDSKKAKLNRAADRSIEGPKYQAENPEETTNPEETKNNIENNTPAKPWEMDENTKKEINSKSEEVAKAVMEENDIAKEEEEFFNYVERYTDGFKELLVSRDYMNAISGARTRPKGKIEDMDYHIKLSELLNKIGTPMRETEEELLKKAYEGPDFSDTEKKIIFKRLNAINPERYPDLEENQK